MRKIGAIAKEHPLYLVKSNFGKTGNIKRDGYLVMVVDAEFHETNERGSLGNVVKKNNLIKNGCI